jgi:hypothetical protein
VCSLLFLFFPGDVVELELQQLFIHPSGDLMTTMMMMREGKKCFSLISVNRGICRNLICCTVIEFPRRDEANWKEKYFENCGFGRFGCGRHRMLSYAIYLYNAGKDHENNFLEFH